MTYWASTGIQLVLNTRHVKHPSKQNRRWDRSDDSDHDPLNSKSKWTFVVVDSSELQSEDSSFQETIPQNDGNDRDSNCECAEWKWSEQQQKSQQSGALRFTNSTFHNSRVLLSGSGYATALCVLLKPNSFYSLTISDTNQKRSRVRFSTSCVTWGIIRELSSIF